MVILRSGVETSYSTMSSRSNDEFPTLEERINIISQNLNDIQDTLAESIEDRDLEIKKL